MKTSKNPSAGKPLFGEEFIFPIASTDFMNHWNPIGVIFGSLWSYFGVILGSFWGHIGSMTVAPGHFLDTYDLEDDANVHKRRLGKVENRRGWITNEGVSIKCNSPSDGPSNSRRRIIRIPSDHVGGYLSVVPRRTGE